MRLFCFYHLAVKAAITQTCKHLKISFKCLSKKAARNCGFFDFLSLYLSPLIPVQNL